MNKVIVCFLMVVAIALFGILFMDIIQENRAMKKAVYTALEKSSLTEDEADFIMRATDPSFMKEGYIVLDDCHAKLFKAHFGRER